jgi:hypothetical protein
MFFRILFLFAILIDRKVNSCRAPVAHTYNCSFLGGRDQEDSGLEPVPDKKLLRPYLKNTQHETMLAEWLKW